MSGSVKRPVVSRSERFVERLERQDLRRRHQALEVVQVNLGGVRDVRRGPGSGGGGPRGPGRMEGPTASRILELVAMTPGVRTLEITGDAPELNPWFRLLVGGGRELGLEVIDRSDLSALLEPGQEELPRFLRRHRVRIVGSLPGLSRETVDARRGRGAFDRMVRALRLLNEQGYGRGDATLRLDLVHASSDRSPPGEPGVLEAASRERLRVEHGVELDRLLAGTVPPVHRLRDRLDREGDAEGLMDVLASSFDPRAVEEVACRSLISVAWDGRLYDCDLHRVLGVAAGGRPRSVWSIESFAELAGEPIAFGDHCDACTAGRGGTLGGLSS